MTNMIEKYVDMSVVVQVGTGETDKTYYYGVLESSSDEFVKLSNVFKTNSSPEHLCAYESIERNVRKSISDKIKGNKHGTNDGVEISLGRAIKGDCRANGSCTYVCGITGTQVVNL